MVDDGHSFIGKFAVNSFLLRCRIWVDPVFKSQHWQFFLQCCLNLFLRRCRYNIIAYNMLQIYYILLNLRAEVVCFNVTNIITKSSYLEDKIKGHYGKCPSTTKHYFRILYLICNHATKCPLYRHSHKQPFKCHTTSYNKVVYKKFFVNGNYLIYKLLNSVTVVIYLVVLRSAGHHEHWHRVKRL